MNTEQFTREARMFAYARRTKHRSERKRRTPTDRDVTGPWQCIGAGEFGEAWVHDSSYSHVLKIGGRECFSYRTQFHGDTPRLDGWALFAKHCFDVRGSTPHLPYIYHFEYLQAGIAMAVMPRYQNIDDMPYSRWGKVAGVTGLRDIIKASWDVPDEHEDWLRPIVEMAVYQGLRVDVHEGNVMYDAVKDTWVLTDPFAQELDD